MKNFVVRKILNFKVAINIHTNDCFEINDLVFDMIMYKSSLEDYLYEIMQKYDLSFDEVLDLENEITEILNGS